MGWEYSCCNTTTGSEERGVLGVQMRVAICVGPRTQRAMPPPPLTL